MKAKKLTEEQLKRLKYFRTHKFSIHINEDNSVRIDVEDRKDKPCYPNWLRSQP